jgi:hypothetical protein
LVIDYRRKAENAVDYEDIQEQYEGPEVQLGPQDMQIYAQAALVGQPKLPDEDNYDDDDDDDDGFDSAEQPAEAASSLDTGDCVARNPETTQNSQTFASAFLEKLGAVQVLSADFLQFWDFFSQTLDSCYSKVSCSTCQLNSATPELGGYW